MAWPGGKDGAGVYQRLINQIPPHEIFVSAFLGDCAIMRRKLPAAVSIGIDRSRSNVERWASDQPRPDLQLYCCCGIEWLKHAFGLYLVESPKKAAGDRHQLQSLNPAAAAAAAQFGGEDLRRVFVYIDPPYLIEARRSRRKIYDHELTEDQHVELLATAVRLPCQVMISHYPHPMYARTLAGWRSFTFDAQTRSGRSAREQVWCNYPEPEELHDARYVGGDKRERERVRRRVRNWTSGLERMHPVERQAIIDAIAAKYFVRPEPPENAAEFLSN